MRRTLVALLFTLGISACGGTEEAAQAEPSDVHALFTRCISACWGVCEGDLECRAGCQEQCAGEPLTGGDDGNTLTSQDHPNPGIQCSGDEDCLDGYVCDRVNNVCVLGPY